ncbi:LOW QUALITY PROTEIN: hypothetical protein PanWU01x14_274360 [Parasponia andersonii]|uniref:Uncharacterized protein n=1 Tax=Parasponia andersonii TaxID=3476 RepID=A0A2P5B3Q1_PARAD|nr:LOW QUALITY PROTEIN: hypothetical protein PanWU01x14_274360 [Parasponia andersonii]
MIEPEDPTRPKHSIDIKQQEMQQSCRNPVAEHVHGVDDIQRVIKKRKPLNAYVQRNNPSRSYETIERSVQVHRRRHNRHVPFHHSHRKRRCPTADIKPDTNRAGLPCPQNLIDTEIEPAVLAILTSTPTSFLPSL